MGLLYPLPYDDFNSILTIYFSVSQGHTAKPTSPATPDILSASWTPEGKHYLESHKSPLLSYYLDPTFNFQKYYPNANCIRMRHSLVCEHAVAVVRQPLCFKILRLLQEAFPKILPRCRVWYTVRISTSINRNASWEAFMQLSGKEGFHIYGI
jgi:hypothetical protein